MRGPYTTEERLAQYAKVVEGRLRKQFEEKKLPYPPPELALLAFKDTRVLEVYARAADGETKWVFVKQYGVEGASGNSGPKLKEGDKQVPEGIYAVTALNPNSRFHLSLRLDYPNAFDQEMGKRDGRTRLGSDIMIHGENSSVGCLAMGNDAAEDLFVLAALVGLEKVKVVISPTDFRKGGTAALAATPSWVHDLYWTLRLELTKYAR